MLHCHLLASYFPKLLKKDAPVRLFYSGAYEGDAWFPSGAPVLKYGKSLIIGPYTCTSQKSGLICKRGEHGFEANRKGITTY